MRQLLLSMVVLFAFTMTSQAQYGPGDDNGLGGGDGEVLPDLVILNTTTPAVWATAFGATFQVTVRNRHNAVGVAASKIRIDYSWDGSYSGSFGIIHNSTYVDVPAFDAYETDKVVTVAWSPGDVNFYGPFITLVSIEADGLHVITEADETNNVYTP